jgi:hypothetical protein
MIPLWKSRELILLAAEVNEDELVAKAMDHFDCNEVEVDRIGSMWIADPMPGHWLGEEDMSELADALLHGSSL